MTELELETEIALLTLAISHILQTGQKYELGTGQSRRTFEAGDLDSLVALRDKNRQDLYSLQNGGRGMVIGF